MIIIIVITSLLLLLLDLLFWVLSLLSLSSSPITTTTRRLIVHSRHHRPVRYTQPAIIIPAATGWTTNKSTRNVSVLGMVAAVAGQWVVVVGPSKK
jgi:hypothetical protein